MIKINIKQYYLHIISFMIILILILLSVNTYIKNQETHIRISEERYSKYCLTETEVSEDMCINLKNEGMQKYSFFPMIAEVLLQQVPRGVILILFIIIPSCYCITKFLKNKYIVNELTRQKYKKIIKSVFFKAYSIIIAVSFAFLLLFLLCYIYTDTTTLRDYEIGMVSWTSKSINTPINFVVLYIINLIFIEATYVNISLIISRKQHNFLTSVILTFLTIVGIELFFELIVNYTLIYCFKSGKGIIFNIINAVSFNDSYGITPILIFSCFMAIITFIPVLIMYRDSEKLLIDCENNE